MDWLQGKSFGDIVLLVYANPWVRAVLGLLVANVLVGVAEGLYLKSFRLGALGDWLLSRAIPYLLGAGVVQLVLMTVPPEWSGLTEAISSTVWLFVVAALVGKVLGSLRTMGLPIPVVLTDRDKPLTGVAP